MIENFLCEKCLKSSVCKYRDTLNKIADESEKKRMGINIRMNSCEHIDIRSGSGDNN